MLKIVSHAKWASWGISVLLAKLMLLTALAVIKEMSLGMMKVLARTSKWESVLLAQRVMCSSPIGKTRPAQFAQDMRPIVANWAGVTMIVRNLT